MRIGIIGKTTSNENKIINEFKPSFYKNFENAEDLLEFSETFHIILCNSSYESKSIKILKTLRRSKYYLTPIFCSIEINKNYSCDGNYNAKNCNIKQSVKIIIQNTTTIQFNTASSSYESILFFLYTRRDFIIESKTSIDRKTYYYYPILEVFMDDSNKYLIWLEELTNQGFINKLTLKDRVYSCIKCNSIKLKFTPHCPECNSINIKTENFLHCFTCGFNGIEEEFLNKNRLTCPNCKTSLKLYGSDYDRPLENMICEDCNSVFIEPNTKVTCLSCNNVCNSNELQVMEVYDFKLSEVGFERIKNGIHSMFYFTDNDHFLQYDLFLSVLDWFIKAQNRYKSHYFELIGIKLSLNSIADYDFFKQFCHTLYDKIREVDITTKSPDGIIWIIFPFIERDNNKIILEKLNTIFSSINGIDSNQEKNPVKYINFSSNKENIKYFNSRVLISQLTGSL